MSDSQPKITVAISNEFLRSFSAIPKKAQSKVFAFIDKFRSNPTAPGINYEKIQAAKDPNMRSVRIDRDYRGIVLRPNSGNVYVMLWVDNHDKAYQWAINKVYQVHPETGSLQVVPIASNGVETFAKGEENLREPGLFDNIRDRELSRLGVPDILIPLVRRLKTPEDLESVVDRFPEEAYEGLYFLSSGEFTLEEVLRDIDKERAIPTVDTDDFAAALQREDSQRRFFVVDDEAELTQIMGAPLEQWRVFLHPSQRQLVERNWNGPVRVLGGAGTGKTVVAIHRAKWLAKNVFTAPEDRILFTTYTKNLAADIKRNLTEICEPGVMRRIEVINLDAWVTNFLRSKDYNFRIDYGNASRSLWEKALVEAPSDLGFSDVFYRDEWEKVVSSQGVTTVYEYLRASRLGRGTALDRKKRSQIWPVFEQYRLLLNENGIKESDDAMRDARIIIQNEDELLPYRSVIVDEAQDMGEQSFKLIRQIVAGAKEKDSLLIVGDAHQRIYRHKVVLGQCGINIMGRGRKLRINYRTTDENRKWAVTLLRGVSVDDLDGDLDTLSGYKSLMHGLDPIISKFKNYPEEINYLTTYLGKLDKQSLANSCLVVRTNELLQQYQGALAAAGVEVFHVKRSQPDDRRVPGLRLATMHRVKGLEFDNILIAAVNEGVVPLETAIDDTSDEISRKEAIVRERALLYVSATRAKKSVIVTSFGEPSEFLL